MDRSKMNSTVFLVNLALDGADLLALPFRVGRKRLNGLISNKNYNLRIELLNVFLYVIRAGCHLFNCWWSIIAAVIHGPTTNGIANSIGV